MKLKTSLIAAATLAVGVISSQAQVYSQNIVGYANVAINSGYNLICIPLTSSTGTNGLSSVLGITNGSAYDGACSFLTWNGHGFTYAAYDSGYGGWIDQNYSPIAEPVINPGTGFFFNSGIASNSIAIVGSVVAASNQTVTNSLTAGYSLVGSAIPFAGAIDNTNINLPIVSNDGAFSILTWNSATGKYIYQAYDSGYGGWIDANYATIPTPTLGVAQGFFYNNGSAQIKWTQVLSQ